MESVFGDGVFLEMECFWRWSVLGDGVLLEIDCGSCFFGDGVVCFVNGMIKFDSS